MTSYSNLLSSGFEREFCRLLSLHDTPLHILQTDDGQTLVHLLCLVTDRALREETFATLFKIKTDDMLRALEVQNLDGNTPLHYIVTKNLVTILHNIVNSHNVEKAITMQNKHGNTILHLAAKSNHTETLRAIIKRPLHTPAGMFLVCNRQGRTPLHEAVYHNCFETVKFLLSEYGTGLFQMCMTMPDINNDLIVHSAILNGNGLILRELMKTYYEENWLEEGERSGFLSLGSFDNYPFKLAKKVAPHCAHAMISYYIGSDAIKKRSTIASLINYENMWVERLSTVSDLEGNNLIHSVFCHGDLDAFKLLCLKINTQVGAAVNLYVENYCGFTPVMLMLSLNPTVDKIRALHKVFKTEVFNKLFLRVGKPSAFTALSQYSTRSAVPQHTIEELLRSINEIDSNLFDLLKVNYNSLPCPSIEFKKLLDTCIDICVGRVTCNTSYADKLDEVLTDKISLALYADDLKLLKKCISSEYVSKGVHTNLNGGNTLLHLAIKHSALHCALFLIGSDKDFKLRNATNNQGDTPGDIVKKMLNANECNAITEKIALSI